LIIILKFIKTQPIFLLCWRFGWNVHQPNESLQIFNWLCFLSCLNYFTASIQFTFAFHVLVRNS